MKNEKITTIRTHESIRFNGTEHNMFYSNPVGGALHKYKQCHLTFETEIGCIKIVEAVTKETVYVPLVNIAYIKTEPKETTKTTTVSKTSKTKAS